MLKLFVYRCYLSIDIKYLSNVWSCICRGLSIRCRRVSYASTGSILDYITSYTHCLFVYCIFLVSKRKYRKFDFSRWKYTINVYYELLVSTYFKRTTSQCHVIGWPYRIPWQLNLTFVQNIWLRIICTYLILELSQYYKNTYSCWNLRLCN